MIKNIFITGLPGCGKTTLIMEILKENETVVIDEIGNMELCSEKFKKAVEITLGSKNKVLGTIKLTPGSFTDKIKKERYKGFLFE